MENRISALLLGIAMAITVYYASNQQAYAHNFTPDESASFLFLVDQLWTEADLVQTNLLFNNTALAQYHAIRASELLDTNTTKEIAERNQRIANDLTAALAHLRNTIEEQHNSASEEETLMSINHTITDSIEPLLQEAIVVRIDEEQLGNSTVRALSLSFILNQIDMIYANAYGIESSGMQAFMGSDNSSFSHTHSNSSSSINDSDDDYQHSSSTNNSMLLVTSIASLVDYQTARALSDTALEVYNEELKASVSANATAAIADLGESLVHLNNAVENMAPPIEVIKIIHGNAQNDLMKAFNLELAY
jgi:predicted DNA-binding ArsR family transcriptional regulator